MSPIFKDQSVALAESIEAFLSNPTNGHEDDATRRRLRDAGRKLSHAMEVDGDVIHRMIHTPMQLAMAAIGVETGVFERLAVNEASSFSHSELAAKAKVDPVLMKRLLRYWKSTDMVDQTGPDEWSASIATKAMGSFGGKNAILCYHELQAPTFTVLPKFLRESGYKNPTGEGGSPFGMAHDTTLPPFLWFADHPELLQKFMVWMQVQRDGLPGFLEVFPFDEYAKNTKSDTPLFVDIGSSAGHQSFALRKKFPNIPGRIILQDLPHVIENVKTNEADGMEAMVYDFFTPQPVKGARAYYLRNILHDWPSEKCVQILKNTIAGMTSDSVILIDEMIMPEMNTNSRQAQLDIAMATCLTAMERDEAQWKELLDAAGLKIHKTYQYTEEARDFIIVAVRK